MKALNSQATDHQSTCFAPEYRRLLTDYCFQHLTEQETLSVENHLNVCKACLLESVRLRAAINVLDASPDLVNGLPPQMAAKAFGISAKLELPWGGHFGHVLIGCSLYAAIIATALALDNDLKLVFVAFTVIFLISLMGPLADWKLTLVGSRWGLAASAMIFFGGTLMWMHRFDSLTFASYLLWTGTALLLPTFHIALVTQRELFRGHHRAVLSWLKNTRWQRKFFWGCRFLLLVLLALACWQPIRLPVLLVAFFVECLAWYFHTLHEIRRECLAAEHDRSSFS